MAAGEVEHPPSPRRRLSAAASGEDGLWAEERYTATGFPGSSICATTVWEVLPLWAMARYRNLTGQYPRRAVRAVSASPDSSSRSAASPARQDSAGVGCSKPAAAGRVCRPHRGRHRRRSAGSQLSHRRRASTRRCCPHGDPRRAVIAGGDRWARMLLGGRPPHGFPMRLWVISPVRPAVMSRMDKCRPGSATGALPSTWIHIAARLAPPWPGLRGAARDLRPAGRAIPPPPLRHGEDGGTDCARSSWLCSAVPVSPLP